MWIRSFISTGRPIAHTYLSREWTELFRKRYSNEMNLETPAFRYNVDGKLTLDDRSFLKHKSKLNYRWFSNLVPSTSFPLTSGRKTRALGATISGMRHRYHRCRLRSAQWNHMGRIRLFPLLFQNGCSQSSRFPTAGQEERSSGFLTRPTYFPDNTKAPSEMAVIVSNVYSSKVEWADRKTFVHF